MHSGQLINTLDKQNEFLDFYSSLICTTSAWRKYIASFEKSKFSLSSNKEYGSTVKDMIFDFR